MYKLLAAAIISVFMIIFVFLFAPGTKRINHKNKEKPVVKTNQEVKTSNEDVSELMSASTNNDEIVTFKKLSNPRGDAASHGMEEKYFVPFDINEFNTMSRNMEERLNSISNARVKKERAKKGYEQK